MTADPNTAAGLDSLVGTNIYISAVSGTHWQHSTVGDPAVVPRANQVKAIKPESTRRSYFKCRGCCGLSYRSLSRLNTRASLSVSSRAFPLLISIRYISFFFRSVLSGG
jgi:hypothetical protein